MSRRIVIAKIGVIIASKEHCVIQPSDLELASIWNVHISDQPMQNKQTFKIWKYE